MKLFKHKNKREPKVYEGRFVTEDEIKEMTKPHKDSMFKKDMDELYEMLDELKHYKEQDYGRR